MKKRKEKQIAFSLKFLFSFLFCFQIKAWTSLTNDVVELTNELLIATPYKKWSSSCFEKALLSKAL